MVQQAYWRNGADLSMQVFVRKMNAHGRIHAPQIPISTLPMYGFMFLLRGRVLLDIGNMPLLLHEGEFLLIPPAMPFGIKYYENASGYTGGFRQGFLKDPTHRALIQKSHVVQSFTHDDALFIDKVFSRMLDAYPDDLSYLKSCLDFVLSHVRIDEHEEKSSVALRFIDGVFDRSRPIGTVASYARELGISADLLNHHVRRYSNCSAIEWIEISRLALAKGLLLETALPIAEVAEKSGIDDPSYFSRFFKRRVGMSPGEFRRKYSKKS